MKSALSLARQSLKFEAKNLTKLLAITGVVVVPVNIIAIVSASTDVTISAYSTLATVLMNIALIWSVLRLLSGQPVKLAAAYYQGTASFVRFLLTSAIIIVQLIPLALGLILYSVGVLGAAPGTSAFEKGIMLALAGLLSAPSVWLVNRSLLALVEVVATDASPVAAIRSSWAAVKGHSWSVLGRWVALIIVTVLLLAIPAIVLILAFGKTNNRGFLVLLQALISIFILPFIVSYIVGLRQDLS